MTGEQAAGTESPGSAGIRSRNPWGQGKRLHAEILAAAGQLLGELGTVDGLTLRGVARRAGITPASIYTQFEDKAALIDAMIAHEQEQIADLMRQAAAEAGTGSHADAVHAQLDAFCRYSLANPGHYRLMFGSHGGRPMLRTLVEQLQASLAACESAGIRLRLSPDRAAIVLLVSAHGRVAVSHALAEENPRESVIQFVDELLGLVLDVK